MYTYPKIYESSIPKKFRGSNPVLSNVVIGPPKHIESPPWYNITQIISKGHNKFITFEKFTDFHAGKKKYFINEEKVKIIFKCSDIFLMH